MEIRETIGIVEAIREHIERPTEEISAGLAITALTGAIEALEKQLPKKPKEDDEQNVRYVTVYVCPYCGKRFTGAASTYCYHCGQKLDWSV